MFLNVKKIERQRTISAGAICGVGTKPNFIAAKNTNIKKLDVTDAKISELEIDDNFFCSVLTDRINDTSMPKILKSRRNWANVVMKVILPYSYVGRSIATRIFDTNKMNAAEIIPKNDHPRFLRLKSLRIFNNLILCMPHQMISPTTESS
jgi:hypothetical protein